MKRFRLSTLMLLIVIAGLCTALAVQHDRAARRQASLQADLALSWPIYLKKQKLDEQLMQQMEYDRRLQSIYAAGERSDAEARLQPK
jgi:hypothetical protein